MKRYQIDSKHFSLPKRTSPLKTIDLVRETIKIVWPSLQCIYYLEYDYYSTQSRIHFTVFLLKGMFSWDYS